MTNQSEADPGKTGQVRLVDDVPLSGIHVRMFTAAAGAPLIDGYILAILGAASAQIVPEFGLSSTQQGVAGAMVLVGIFVGGFLGGFLVDRFGRQRIFNWDLWAIAAVSVGSYWIQGFASLVILRLLAGIAIGVDYPIGPSLVAEFTPRKQRGPFLGALVALYFVGGALAYLAGDLLGTALGDGAWRWMLASAAVPAVIIGLVRIGLPESPRWLAREGRVEEANAVVAKVFGPGVSVDELPLDEKDGRPGILAVFSGGYAKRMVFVIVLWTALLVPVYAIFAFGPQLLTALGLADPADATLASVVVQLIFAVGVISGLFLVNRLGRRALCIHNFLWSGVALLILAIFPSAPTAVAAICFAAYAIISGWGEVLSFVYPSELFPTELRGSAMGVTTAISRIGAAVGTFLVPIALEDWGIGPTMFGAVAIVLVGLIVTFAWAPETRGMTLHQASDLSLAHK